MEMRVRVTETKLCVAEVDCRDALERMRNRYLERQGLGAGAFIEGDEWMCWQDYGPTHSSKEEVEGVGRVTQSQLDVMNAFETLFKEAT